MKLPFGFFVASATSILATLGLACLGIIVCDQLGKSHSRFNKRSGNSHRLTFNEPVSKQIAPADHIPIRQTRPPRRDTIPYTLPRNTKDSNVVIVSNQKRSSDVPPEPELPVKKPTAPELAARYNPVYNIQDQFSQVQSMSVYDFGPAVPLFKDPLAGRKKADDESKSETATANQVRNSEPLPDAVNQLEQQDAGTPLAVRQVLRDSTQFAEESHRHAPSRKNKTKESQQAATAEPVVPFTEIATTEDQNQIAESGDDPLQIIGPDTNRPALVERNQQDEQNGRPVPSQQPAGSVVARPASSQTVQDPAALPQDPKPKAEPSRTNEVIARPIQTPAKSTQLQSSEIVGWPIPTSLMSDLQDLTQISVTSDWAYTTIDAFEQLNEIEISDPASEPLLVHLFMLGEQLQKYSQAMAQNYPEHVETAIELGRISYRMQRRLEIWQQVYRVESLQVADPFSQDHSVVFDSVACRKSQLKLHNIPDAWMNYLMLDECIEVFSDDGASQQKKRTVARQILTRLDSPAMDDQQRDYARQVLGAPVIGLLKDAAVSDLALGKFLTDLESFETMSSPATDYRLNQHYQNYYWNGDQNIRALSNSINSHYRNANFRIEISDQLINRMMPGETEYNQPVRDRILGARVLGQSRVSNRLQVKLIPDPKRLSFRLQSLGNVFSKTRAHHSGFTFYNHSNAIVNASKGIAIGDDGVITQPTAVDASANQNLLNVSSGVDGVPLIGFMARKIAAHQQTQKEPQARQEVESKIKNEFQSRVDQEIQNTISQAQYWLDQRVFNPLNALELEPTALEMRTTDNNVIIRYRVASRDQLAASTARPQSLPGSMLALQIHQTTINNILNKMQINGKEFTNNEFLEHLNQLAESEVIPIDPNETREVTFQFAERDGIRVDLQDQQIEFTLRLKKFRIGKGKTWQNLTVKASYYLQGQGTKMRMVLDEEKGVTLHKRLRLGDQLAIRTAFNVLFQPQVEFDIMPASIRSKIRTDDLAMSQLEITDGWLGISISRFDRYPGGEQQTTPQRTGRLFRRWR